VVELLLDSGASVDKANMVTYRLAFTQTLRERVCVAQWISMCHHGTPQDNIGYCSIELHYTVWQVIFGGANFREKSEKALRINFRGFKFRDINPVQGRGAAQTMM
jgi:hypothetical protein